MRWYEDAACRSANPHLFDRPEKQDMTRERLDEAIAYCRRCPVIIECYDDAVAHCDDGVRGGNFLIDGRIQRLPMRPRIPRPLAPCGTNTAWVRHRRNKEHCAACEQARESARRRRPRKKAA